MTQVKGKVEEVGDWLEWTSDATTIHLAVKPRDGRTQIQFMGDSGFKWIGVYGGAGAAAFLAMDVIGNTVDLGVGLAAGVVAVAYGLARGAWHLVGRRAALKYRGLVDELTAEAARLAGPATESDAERLSRGRRFPLNRASRTTLPQATSRADAAAACAWIARHTRGGVNGSASSRIPIAS
jgi:hypothetical protein